MKTNVGVSLTLLILLICIVNKVNAQDSQATCSHAKRFSFESNTGYANNARSNENDNYDVTFYFVDIQADNLSVSINANVEMKARVVTPTLSTVLVDLSGYLIVDSVLINNVRSEFTHEDDQVRITTPSELTEGEFFTSKIYYRGTPETGGFFSGISNGFSQTFGAQATWTLSEPLNAKDWFACKQVLTDKADSAYIFVTVPDHLKAGSNGLLTNITELPDNKHRFEWKTRYPIAYYLISLAIADYQEYNVTATVNDKEILVQNFLYDHPNVLPSFKNDLDEVTDMLVYFSEAYGMYPFADEKYGHAMAPFGGGMEHQTMSTMGTFNFTLDAHELGHQWFGDNVTCATWQDIWINEGFARYSEYLALEHLRSETVAKFWMSENYSNVVSLPTGSVYVPVESATNENRIFDFRLTYNKGGALVHMIRNIVDNDPVFFNMLRTFQETYKDSVATGDDFKRVLEETSQIDFDAFFNEWYYGEGYPTYSARWNHDSDTLYVNLTQTASSNATPFFHNPVDLRVNFEGGSSQIIRFYPDEDTTLHAMYMTDELPVTGLSIDPNSWLLKKIGLVDRDHSLKAPSPPITSLEETLRNKFMIYPNPVDETLRIETADSNFFRVEMMDIHGKLLGTHEAQKSLSEINTSSLPAGLFLIRITTESGSFFKKMVKK
ncbi:MAG TPA: M1 family aminopeptidase [Chryseosolibacter sp.]|nr:M1 family aminopeptidase [Chryseosolibacter sp.]